MSFILAVSIAIRLVAMAWTVVLVRRSRDWRLLFLTAMLALLAARQILALSGSSGSPGSALTVGGQVAESAGLAVSIMALFAVFALDGVLLRSKRVDEENRSRDRGEPALAPVAITIGAIAVAGCVTVGVLAYNASRDASLSHIAEHNLETAQSIDEHLEALLVDMAPEEPNRKLAIEEVERIWRRTPRPHPQSYLCVVDSSGTLALHTAWPDMVGRDVGSQEIHPDAPSDPRTVAELVEAKREWSGRNLNTRGASQLVGFAYSDTLDSLIVVHTPTHLVADDLAAAALPWGAALALLAGVLIPLSLGLLHRSYSNSQRSLLATTRDLRVSEDRLRFQAQLLSSVHESVVAADLEGTITFWGRGAETLYGRTADETLGRNITLIVAPPEAEEERERWRQVRETGHWSGQYIQRRKDGSSFWADTFISLVRDDNGEPCGYIGIDRDITARKEAQEALQHTTSQLALMLDSMPVITCTRRAEGDFATTFVSRNAEEVTGYAVESFTSEPSFWIERVHPDDKPHVLEQLSKILESDVLKYDYRWRTADGTYRWFNDVLRVVRNDAGEPSHLVGVLQDITERRNTDDSLRESEGRFRQLTEHIGEVFWLTDWKDNEVLYVSPAYETIWGRSVGSLYEDAASWADCIHPDDRERVIDSFRRNAERGTYDEEYRIVRADGSMRWIQDRAFPIENADGKVFRVAGLSADITDRKEAEEEMKQLHFAIENAMTGISRLDASGCFVEVRSAYAEMLGYSPEQMIGMSWEPTVLMDDRAQAAAAYRRMLEEGQADAEVRALRRDGTVFIKHILLIKSLNREGLMDGHYCFMRDVTDRKRADERLAESESWFRAIFESEPECITVTDPAGTVLDVNPRGLEFLEVETIDQVRGNSVYPFVAHEFRDEVAAATRAVFRGEARRVVYEIVGAGGTRRWLDSHMVPLRNARGEVCAQLAVNRDITERRRTEEELKRRTVVERLLFRELDHRVRNNLSSLVTLIDITGANARDTTSFASAIRGRVQAMATVHGMLTQSKWSKSSLRDLARSLVPASVHGDLVITGDEVLVPPNQASSLGMVLHELFTNSVKYGALGADGARIEIACEVRDADDAGAKVAMSWRERGGPLVEVKPTPGVGTSLIQGLVTNDLRGAANLHYAPEGVDHRFTLQLANDDTVSSGDDR